MLVKCGIRKTLLLLLAVTHAHCVGHRAVLRTGKEGEDSEGFGGQEV